MNKTDFQAQMAANFVAAEIRHNGLNGRARKAQLQRVFDRADFALTDMTCLLDTDWTPTDFDLAEEAVEKAKKARAAAAAVEAATEADGSEAEVRNAIAARDEAMAAADAAEAEAQRLIADCRDARASTLAAA